MLGIYSYLPFIMPNAAGCCYRLTRQRAKLIMQHYRCETVLALNFVKQIDVESNSSRENM